MQSYRESVLHGGKRGGAREAKKQRKCQSILYTFPFSRWLVRIFVHIVLKRLYQAPCPLVRCSLSTTVKKITWRTESFMSHNHAFQQDAFTVKNHLLFLYLSNTKLFWQLMDSPKSPNCLHSLRNNLSIMCHVTEESQVTFCCHLLIWNNIHPSIPAF